MERENDVPTEENDFRKNEKVIALPIKQDFEQVARALLNHTSSAEQKTERLALEKQAAS